MKKLATILGLAAVLAMAATSAFAANQVRISQAYGGGGGSTGTYINDFVEILNNGGTPVNIGGWTIEYGSATGNWGSSTGNIFTFPANTIIQPCKYILVQLGAAGTAGVAFPVTPDFTSTNLSMSATSGKVALFSAVNSNLACGAELPGTLVDKVSYGSANCPEVTNVPALSSTSSALRNNGGVTDTDNNLSDFTISTTVVPRNSASPANTACLATPTSNRTWGSLKSIYR